MTGPSRLSSQYVGPFAKFNGGLPLFALPDQLHNSRVADIHLLQMHSQVFRRPNWICIEFYDCVANPKPRLFCGRIRHDIRQQATRCATIVFDSHKRPATNFNNATDGYLQFLFKFTRDIGTDQLQALESTKGFQNRNTFFRQSGNKGWPALRAK